MIERHEAHKLFQVGAFASSGYLEWYGFDEFSYCPIEGIWNEDDV